MINCIDMFLTMKDRNMPIPKECEFCSKIYQCRKDKITYSRFCSRLCTTRNAGLTCSRNRENKWLSEDFKTYMMESFNRFIIKTDSCWEWIGTRGGKESEYGRLTFRGKDYKAHRASYFLYKGDIPPKKYVLHSCDVRYCVNPDHLFLGTHDDNMKDMTKKGRNKPRAKLSLEQVLEIKRLLCLGVTTVKLAKDYGVSSTCIWYIKHNKSWNK